MNSVFAAPQKRGEKKKGEKNVLSDSGESRCGGLFAGRQPFGEKGGACFGRDGTTEVIALHLVAAVGAQKIDLVAGLDPFGDAAHA